MESKKLKDADLVALYSDWDGLEAVIPEYTEGVILHVLCNKVSHSRKRKLCSLTVYVIIP